MSGVQPDVPREPSATQSVASAPHVHGLPRPRRGSEVDTVSRGCHGPGLGDQPDTDLLGRATSADRLRLAYQPIVDTRTGRWVAVEALLRSTHHAHGSPRTPTRPPGGARSVDDLERQIVELAVRDLALVRALTGLRRLKVAVNVSSTRLAAAGWLDHLGSTLDEAGLGPSSVCLELSETTVSRDAALALRVSAEACARGIGVALDDFGAGCSSLADLTRMPLTSVKLDGILMRGVAARPRALRVLSAVTHLCQDLGLTVTAERVENGTEEAVARSAGCDALQGYALCRPLHLPDLICAALDWPGHQNRLPDRRRIESATLLAPA
jgi:EAL domain-containing protein (putative c-di-GMP-specific phosphodiesterase class I)